ncbi:MAG: DUF4911 domain-containing protein [Deltaproteobacteria bacterium]|nr:DUF4911 domain-containing protein [Deltaproteobacteria bacterium]
MQASRTFKTIKKYFRIDRREICFLKFIIEAYDGIAVLTTIDPAKGIVVINIAPGCEEEVEMIIKDLEKNIMIEAVSNPFPIGN